MDDDDKVAQDDELIVLQSIYDEKYFSVEDSKPPCGRFSAHVQLPDPFYIRLTKTVLTSGDSNSDSNCSETDFEEFVVQYLPAINLYFEFPVNYPSESPPAFFLSCSWLSYEQLSKLCKHLDDLWNESCGAVVLFRWVQFLKEETLSFLNIDNCLDITELSKFNLKSDIINSVPFDDQSNNKVVISDTNTSETSDNLCTGASGIILDKAFCIRTVKPSISGGNGSRDCRAFLDIADGKILKTALRDYDEFKKAEDFQHAWHSCSVCFISKLGSEFVTFKACQHFFCRDCVKSYFELMISEGNVQSLNCPYEKCSTQADGTLVKQVVSKTYFERYDSLLLSRTLDTMTDIAYCPRKACQCPLLIDVGERMGSCPACKFVFCIFCKMAYHGIAPCKFNPALKQQICNEYLQGDAFKKAEMENRHGKRTIRSLVEEVLSEKWIGSNSKPCPRCNASIEKTEGCNKMTCFSCGSFFCWLCTKPLKTSNPYSHFSDKSSECYDKLFPDDYMDEEFMFEPGEFLNY